MEQMKIGAAISVNWTGTVTFREDWMKQSDDANRRTAPRYHVEDRFFLTFRPSFETMGKIRDISKTGIGFEYTAFTPEETLRESDADPVEVDIFSSFKEFHLSRIPCKVVYDVSVGNSSFTIGLFENRRCGLQFSGLTGYQANQLGTLIRNYSQYPVKVQ